MKKNLFLIMFVFFFVFLFQNNIEADVNSYTEGEVALESGACGGSDNDRACMNTEWYENPEANNIKTPLYGARVALVDKYGKVVSGTQPLNFWATNSMKDYINGLTLFNKMSYTNVFASDTGLHAEGFWDIEDSGYTYSQYLSILTEQNVLAYLNRLYGRNVSIADFENYYLKFEPIYVVRYLCDKGSRGVGASCRDKVYFFGGTTREILYGIKNNFKSTDAAKDYATNSNYGIIYQGPPKIKPGWQVMVNYIKTTYITSSPQGSSIPYFSGVLSNSYSTNAELYNLYETKEGLGVGYVRIKDYITSCEDLVKSTDSIDRRIELYNNFNFRGILNISNVGNAACSSVSHKPSTVSCLTGSAGTDEFSKTNLSHYSELIDVNGTTGYCLSSFSLRNVSLYPFNSSITITSGKLIPGTDGVVTRGTLTQKCYIPGYNGANIYKTLDYSNRVGNVYLGNNNLITVSSPTPKSLEYNSGSGLYEASVSVDYKFPPIYLQKITGKPFSTHCPNCEFLGYGLLSGLKDSGSIYLNFKFQFDGNKHESNSCSYLATPELVTKNDNLNLVFRSIYTENAFLNKEGSSSRSVGSNWCYGSDCSADNCLVNNVMENRNDSNNKKNSDPLYKITLTPSDIKEIRKYNKKTTYDDYTLICDEEENCKSVFLESLRNGNIVLYDINTNKLEQIGNVSNVLETHTLNYNEESEIPNWLNEYDSTNKNACLVEEKICKVVEDNDSSRTVTMGDKISCTLGEGIDNFYVVSNNGSYVEMLTEKNIHTKNYRQSDDAGDVSFSKTKYWSNETSNPPAYIYDENSLLYPIVEGYVSYLNTKLSGARGSLLTYSQAENLGCSNPSCKQSPRWVYSTNYWIGSAGRNSQVWRVYSSNTFYYFPYTYNYGVRPVITISLENISH